MQWGTVRPRRPRARAVRCGRFRWGATRTLLLLDFLLMRFDVADPSAFLRREVRGSDGV